MAAKKAQKTKIEPKKPEIVEDGNYSMVFTKEEMVSTIQILSFAKSVYEQMALDCEKKSDTKGAGTWAARAHLSVMLYKKLQAVANIGEPESRELH